MNKKFILLPFVALLISGCGEPIDKKDSGEDPIIDPPEQGETTVPEKKTITGTVYSGNFLTTNLEFTFDLREFVKDPNTYNPAIAKYAIVVDADLADNWYVDFKDMTVTRDGQNDKLAIYKELGLDDIVLFDNYKSEFEFDKYDTTRFVMAHKQFKISDKAYDVMVINYAYTQGPLEWISNLDVGVDDPIYNNFGDAEHPDWLDKKNHKGFDVSANRTMPDIEKYISDKLDPEAEKVICVTGYSRGAGIANIAAKLLIDKNMPKTSVISYNYGTPNTVATTEDVVTPYKTIYNLVNEDDCITMLPSKHWGFTRYGQNLSYKVRNQETASKFKEMNGKDYVYTDGLSDASAKYFGRKRTDLYTPYMVTYREAYSDEPFNEYGSSYVEATANRAKVLANEYTLGLQNYSTLSNLSIVVPENKDASKGNVHGNFYSFYFKTSGGALVQIAKNTITTLDAAGEFPDITSGDIDIGAAITTMRPLAICLDLLFDKINIVADIIKDSNSVVFPHLPQSYYFVADHVNSK